MQVKCGITDLGMTKQNLDGAQVGAGFQHMGREAVSKQMRRNALLDARAFRVSLQTDRICCGVIDGKKLLMSIVTKNFAAKWRFALSLMVFPRTPPNRCSGKITLFSTRSAIRD
jgi:hypothetical protein